MEAILVLVVIVSGFIYNNRHPKLRLGMYRFSDQRLYLQVAKFGIFFFIVSLFLNALLFEELRHLEQCDLETKKCKKYIDFLYQSVSINFNFLNQDNLKYISSHIPVFFVLVGTLILPYFWLALHRIYRRFYLQYSEEDYAILQTWDMLKDSPLDATLFMAIIDQITLMLVLSDGKVYVGRVLQMGEPNDSKEISFLPIKSGYRDKEAMKIHFNKLYPEYISHEPVILKQEMIVSAREFDQAVYDEFNRHNADQ